jgi:regulator of replication initiation timing
MESSVNTRPTDPHDVSAGLSTQEIELVSRADERLTHAFEQIVRADEQLARVNEQISKLEQDAPRRKFANRFRRPSHGRPALRGLVGLLLTAGICAAAFAWQSYGETARLMTFRWAPQLAAASQSSAETPRLADQQSPPAVQVAAADGALSPLPPPAQPVPPLAAAPIPPELTELLQTMARDLANVQQGIEQLKTSHEELIRENARIAEQLKASQEQITRAANASEQNLRRSTPATVPPRIATPARRPVSAPPPTEARAQARAPVPLRSGQQ